MAHEEDLHVTIATASDLIDLASLADEFRQHLGQDEPTHADFARSFERLLADGATEFHIARNADGDAIGYLQCRIRYSAWTSGWDAELEDVFITAAVRRQGFGRRLVQFALSRFCTKQYRRVGLNTNERNLAALVFYERFSFRAERPAWQGGRQLWLQKHLSPEPSP